MKSSLKDAFGFYIKQHNYKKEKNLLSYPKISNFFISFVERHCMHASTSAVLQLYLLPECSRLEIKPELK